MKKVILFAVIFLIGIHGYSQDSQNSDTVITAKLLGYALEKIPNTKYKWRTVFTFSGDSGRTFTINQPGEPAYRGAIFIPPFGLCYLQADTVYTFQMQRVRLSEVSTFPGSFYSEGFVKEDPTSGKIVYYTVNQESAKRDQESITREYVDIDGKIYRLRDLHPWHGVKRMY